MRPHLLDKSKKSMYFMCRSCQPIYSSNYPVTSLLLPSFCTMFIISFPFLSYLFSSSAILPATCLAAAGGRGGRMCLENWQVCLSRLVFQLWIPPLPFLQIGLKCRPSLSIGTCGNAHCTSVSVDSQQGRRKGRFAQLKRWDVQGTGEASSPQKATSSTTNQNIS